MRSSELARLADVSIRTLRHYHQVGVLVEPQRSANGYREYDVHDLVRVLRIKRLAALGIPLDRIRDVDGAEAAGDVGADELLAELDAELVQQMDRLQGQRDAIATLRAHRAAPDLPLELVPFFAPGEPTGLPEEIAKMDREFTGLLTHLAGDESTAKMVGLFEQLNTPELRAASAEFAQRWSSLGEHSTQAEIDELVTEYRHVFIDGINRDDLDGIDLSEYADLVNDYQDRIFNPQQREVIMRLGQDPIEGSGSVEPS